MMVEWGMGFVMMNTMMQTVGMMAEIAVGPMLTQISVPYVPVMVSFFRERVCQNNKSKH